MIPKSLATYIMPNIVRSHGFRPRSVLVEGIVRFRLATGQVGPPPAFVIIGTQRGGTTNLYNLLIDHPQIFPALVKEAHYFNSKWRNGLEWYQAHFSPDCRSLVATEDKPISGEATPCYLFDPHAADRVAEQLPNTKFIALLRNPVDRAYSHYALSRSWGHETLSFEEALQREHERIDEDDRRMREDRNYYGVSRHRYSYVARGIYADQLPSWLDHFGPDRLLILQSEEFFRKPVDTLDQVIEFLGLSPWEPDFGRGYPKLQMPPMDPEIRQQLSTFFEPHNQRLYELLGVEYDWK